MKQTQIFRTRAFRSFFVTGVILLAEIVVLFLLIRAVDTKATAAVEEKKMLYALQEERFSYEQLESDYETIFPYLDRIETALPTEETLFRVVDALEGAAGQHGLLMSFSLESQMLLATEFEGVRYVPFSATLDGTYAALRAYLAELETLPVWINIEELSVSGRGSIVNGGRVSMQGQIYTR